MKFLGKKTAIGSFVLFVLLILLVKLIDVSSVGAAGTTIGLSHLNLAFHEATGVHMLWYTLTDIFGYIALLVVAGFGLMGLAQLIQRKSLRKMDPEILILGGTYVVTMALYVFFEKVIINYRPILMPGMTEAEASFPSSHTMLICVVMGTALFMTLRYENHVKHVEIYRIVFSALLVLTVIGRLICGVHWLTDILGGLLISLTILSLFNLCMQKVSHE